MNDEAMLEQMGFMLHRGSVHTARTIMLDELAVLLDAVPVEASSDTYRHAICEQNCLGKRSRRTRGLTARHLSELYGLSPGNPIFAGLRYFWARDEQARAQLALLAANATDTLMREIAPSILALEPGAHVSREYVEQLIADRWPSRFGEATLKSTAQNINSSLTKSGHLQGRVKKLRRELQPAVGAVAFALYLGWLQGERGEFLLRNHFCKLLGDNSGKLLEIAAQASARGWMVLRHVDSVIEVSFPELEAVADAACSSATNPQTAS